RHRFDRQQIAADLRPRESRDLPHLVLALRDAVRKAADAEILVEILRVDIDRPLRATHFAFALFQQQRFDDLAADLADVALEIAHAGFARVITDDVAQRALGHVQLFGPNAVVLHLLLKQVLPRDRDLLVFGVAGKTD